MKYFLILILIFSACNISSKENNSDNSNNIYYSDEQKRNCEECAKTSNLINFGYEKEDCQEKCSTVELEESCLELCRLTNLTLLEQAKTTCYVNFQCPQINFNNGESENELA